MVPYVFAGQAWHAPGSGGSGLTSGTGVAGFTTHALEALGTGRTCGSGGSALTDGSDLCLQVAEGVRLGSLLASLGLGQLRQPWSDLRGWFMI